MQTSLTNKHVDDLFISWILDSYKDFYYLKLPEKVEFS